GAHAFLMLQKDGTTPVAYDPCREIHYVTTSTTNAPEGATRLIDDAIKTLSSITGLKFVDDGATKESPNDARPAFQPDRYGQRWAPVLISWSTASESPRLAVTTPDGAPPGSTVDVLGYAGSVSAGFTSTGSATVKAGEPKGLTVDSTEPGSAPRNRAAQDRAAQDQAAQDRAALVPWAAQAESTVSEDRVYVTGSLVLDSDNFTEMLAQFDGYARARATVLHELGHLVGLNHVGDANQLMTPSLNSSLTEFAAGDREGLAALGKGACMPEI
ncbi:MAG TPA: matrixin family metalloprotease, partial [Microthrixaceae bacterium]|nr:matrixin family metalloprotease [Microthrixaceae bacterium]